MDMSEYVATLRRELATITRFASDDVARAAEMLTDAMESSVRLTLLEVISAAADEITTRLDGAAIDVRLAGNDADFVVTVTTDEPDDEAAGQAPGATADDAGSARITLRLSDALKASVEAAAAEAGISVNTWLVQAARRGLDSPGGGSNRRGRQRSPGVGQRFTGYARS
jgi:HicB family